MIFVVLTQLVQMIPFGADINSSLCYGFAGLLRRPMGLYLLAQKLVL
jgi:hypothetical protein